MKKVFMRICSLAMVLAMLINMLPLNSLAAEIKNDELETISTIPAEELESVYILEEIKENRTKYSKEFRLSNGLYMASVYPSAVHYEKDGSWEEINNTLTLSTSRSDSVYTNTAGEWQVSFPQKISSNNGVFIQKDGYTLSFRMAGELYASQNDDAIMDVPPSDSELSIASTEPLISEEESQTESTLEDTTDLMVESTVPVEEDSVPTEASDPNETTPPVETEEMLPFENNIATTGETIISDEEAVVLEEIADTVEETLVVESVTEPAEPTDATDITSVSLPIDVAMQVHPLQEVSAELETIDVQAIKESVEFAETITDKISSRIRYDGIYENTNIIYDLDSNRVKESIVIGQYNPELRGYRYVLEVGNLSPVLTDTGKIELYDANGEDLIMVMPMPYLVDDAYEYCFEVEVELKEENESYVLSYLLPQEWLADEERQWPVVLDPIVEADTSTSNIQDQTVYSETYINYESGIHQVGYRDTYGIGRTYIMYDTLPSLTSADIIVSAALTMYKPANSGTSAAIGVHKVNETWSVSEIKWSNKAGYDSTIEDYVLCQNSGYYNWDVTEIVRGWYAGDNTGLMLKASSSVESAATDNWKQFYSADYGSYYKPTLSIMFRNNSGLESYWDYTASSAGRAGAGYVNNYTGNLVWVRNDMGFGGNRMPVSISHVYNANDNADTFWGLGAGWRTNYNQRIYYWNENTAAGDYYVWEDGDGTAHYFLWESAGVYKDEDGLELTFKNTGSGTEKYSIEDKYGNVSYFDTNGRLTKMVNNQQTQSSITIEYTATTGKRISSITDGAGRVYALTYSGGLLTRMAYMGTGNTELSYLTFQYDGYNLISITDKDGKVCSFTYTTNNLLSSAQDVDGYKLSYTYTTTETGKPNRIRQITETDGSVSGGALTFGYAKNQTTLTD